MKHVPVLNMQRPTSCTYLSGLKSRPSKTTMEEKDAPSEGLRHAKDSEKPQQTVPKSRSQLAALFDSMQKPLEDRKLLEHLLPRLETDLKSAPKERAPLLQEMLDFVAEKVAQHESSPCTLAELHAIVYALNGNEILLEDAAEVEENDDQFLRELAECVSQLEKDRGAAGGGA